MLVVKYICQKFPVKYICQKSLACNDLMKQCALYKKYSLFILVSNFTNYSLTIWRKRFALYYCWLRTKYAHYYCRVCTVDIEYILWTKRFFLTSKLTIHRDTPPNKQNLYKVVVKTQEQCLKFIQSYQLRHENDVTYALWCFHC